MVDWKADDTLTGVILQPHGNEWWHGPSHPDPDGILSADLPPLVLRYDDVGDFGVKEPTQATDMLQCHLEDGQISSRDFEASHEDHEDPEGLLNRNSS